jgi:hypothetical protein
MTEHSKAHEARKGLIDSVKGKAKENRWCCYR